MESSSGSGCGGPDPNSAGGFRRLTVQQLAILACPLITHPGKSILPTRVATLRVGLTIGRPAQLPLGFAPAQEATEPQFPRPKELVGSDGRAMERALIHTR